MNQVGERLVVKGDVLRVWVSDFDGEGAVMVWRGRSSPQSLGWLGGPRR